MVNVLSKIASAPKGGSTEKDDKLKKDGLECLVYIMRSLVNWSKDLLLEKKELAEEKQEEINMNESQKTHHRKNSSFSDHSLHIDKDSPDFAKLKQFKLLVKEGAAFFDKSEKKGMRWFIEQGLVKQDPQDIAEFFYKTPELSKRSIGELLGEKADEWALVREKYVSLFTLKGIPLDLALRKFLSKFRLPPEAQKIDRIIERFAGQYFDQNKGTPISPFANADAVYLFAFATVMLATDAHSHAIKPEQKMTKQQWYHQHKGGNDSSDFPESFLSDVFDRIVAEPLRTSDTIPTSNNSELADPKHRREIFATEMEEVIKTTRMALKEGSSVCFYFF